MTFKAIKDLTPEQQAELEQLTNVWAQLVEFNDVSLKEDNTTLYSSAILAALAVGNLSLEALAAFAAAASQSYINETLEGEDAPKPSELN